MALRLSNSTSKPSCQFKVQISDMELVQIKKLLQYISKNVVKAENTENTLISKTKNKFFLDACTDLTHFCILIDQNNIVNFCFAMICSRNCFIQAYRTIHSHWYQNDLNWF